jgi:hypothetical protein
MDDDGGASGDDVDLELDDTSVEMAGPTTRRRGHKIDPMDA